MASDSRDRPLPIDERDFRFLVENTEDLISVVAQDGTVVYVNERGAAKFGIPLDSVLGRPMIDLIVPEEIPRVLALRAARHAGLPSPPRYESIVHLPEAGRFEVEVTATGTMWEGKPADIVILRDISARRRADAQIRHREEVLKSIATAAECLVQHASWMDGVDDVLESIGKAVQVDRAYLWEAATEPDGEIRVLRAHVWTSETHRLETARFSYEGLRLRAGGFGRQIEILRRGDLLIEPLSSYPEPSRSAWSAAGIRSILAAPIRVDDQLWGVMGFSDCTQERSWTATEIDATRVLASMMGALARRERIRRDLELSEEQLRLTVEQAPAGIFITDQTGRYIEVNSSACQMLGYTREELLQLSIPEIVAPEFRDFAVECFERVVGGESITREVAVRTKSGENLPVEITGKRLSDGRIQGLVIDITERKQVHEELRRRDAILEVVSTAAERFLNSAAWEEQIGHVLEELGQITGADRAFLYENQLTASGELLTLRRYGWINPDSPGTVHPDALAGMRLDHLGLVKVMEDLQGGRVLQVMRSQLSPELARVLAEIHISALTVVPILVGKELWGYFGLAEYPEPRKWLPVELEALRTAGDIIGALVRRRRVEAALRASEARYRTVVEGTKQSIVLIDRYGVFRFGNSTAAMRLGLTQESLIGKTMWDLFPHEIAEAQMDLLRQAIDRREPVVVERPTVVLGIEKWHETRIHPLVDDERRCDSALVLINDIGDRKKAEAEILSYQRRLRSLSSELLLTEETERRRIAAELHDRIGQSLALTKMKLGLARREASSDRMTAAIDEIRLLLDSTIQATRSLTFELSPPILYELGFEPAVEWLAERFQAQHKISSRFEDDQLPKPLRPDLRVFLFQAVQELLMNVVKHASASKVRVSARRAGDQIVVAVEDDGVGCEPEQVAAAGTTETGFGLFNIRERLGLLGGRLEIERMHPRGTRACLRAPLSLERAAEEGN